jgi:hypothetical protein
VIIVITNPPYHIPTLQISDVDTQRCRSGRLNYLGWISFAAIAVPMTCILFNEAVGNAIVDAAIPAVYSAILVLGAYLYSISLLALLVTFFLVLAAANYWAFVYRPASLAHSRRKSKLKIARQDDMSRLRRSASSAGLSASSRAQAESVGAYMWRILNIWKRSIQHGITLVSFRRIRHAKKLASTQMWCGMNRSLIFQGLTINDSNLSPESPGKGPQDSFRRIGGQSSASMTPGCITDMMTATSKGAKSPQADRRRTSFLTRFNSGIDLPEQRVVTRMGGVSTKKGVTFQRLFNSRQFLSSLRSKIIGSTISHSDEPLSVPDKELFEKFEKLLDAFYPDGVALSVVEKSEACDLCRQWIDTTNEENDELYPNLAREGHMIMFSVFEEWFIRVIMSSIKHALSDRLLDISLRHTLGATKRLALSARFSPNASFLRPNHRVQLELPDRETNQDLGQ